MKESGYIVQCLACYGHGNVPSPFHGFYEAGRERILNSFGQPMHHPLTPYTLTCSGCLVKTRFCMMRSCSLRIPSKRASGVGGQPGT